MSIKAYAYTDKTQLSKHFNVSEFACKCGEQHEILISEELIEKLEQLYAALGASKGIISSGYRCSAHDKNVGGYGSGQHTKGMACDVIFYKGSTPISSKTVCCKAQDLGFGGIANITSSYTYTHLDVRTSNIYKGDETRGTSTVTSDFYEYFGLKSQSAERWDYSKDDLIGQLQAVLNSKGAKLQCDAIAGDKTLEVCKKYTINSGDRGILTKWVQTRLNVLGFDCGEADGIAGNKTMSAIAEFQKANGLGQGYLGGSDWYYIIK